MLRSPEQPRADARLNPNAGIGFREFVAIIAAAMAVNALAIEAMLPALPEIGAALGAASDNQARSSSRPRVAVSCRARVGRAIRPLSDYARGKCGLRRRGHRDSRATLLSCGRKWKRAMGQVLIRNLDDRVIERLKLRAARDNTSLEQTLRTILTKAAEPSRAEIVAEIDALRERIGPVPDDSTALIREDRDNDEPYR